MRQKRVKVKRTYRQNDWKAREKAKGNCIHCGYPRNVYGDSPFSNFCLRHGSLHRLKIQRFRKGRRWQKGRRGAAPRSVPVKDRYEVDRLFPALPPRHNKRKRGKNDGERDQQQNTD